MTTGIAVLTHESLMNQLLEALRSLGGSATIEEMEPRTAEIARLTPEQLQVLHGETNRTQFSYRLAWTRTYLKLVGLLENSGRGVWALTAKGMDTDRVDPVEIRRAVHAMSQAGKGRGAPTVVPDDGDAAVDVVNDEARRDAFELPWQEQALRAILEISPSAFERLAQRILRESGFVQVEVTGKSGDGGIDGKGILRIGLLSFHVSFQCKRWQGPVSSPTIREFRGAMMGRADKGLIITTSSFTRDAIREATRDGAPPIDLMDGQQLVEKLKELNLGIATRLVEDVSVDAEWFARI